MTPATVLIEKEKANAAVALAKENKHRLSFRPGMQKLMGFANTAGPNGKVTQDDRISCYRDANGEKFVGSVHRESKQVLESVDPRALPIFWPLTMSSTQQLVATVLAGTDVKEA